MKSISFKKNIQVDNKQKMITKKILYVLCILMFTPLTTHAWDYYVSAVATGKEANWNFVDNRIAKT